MEQTILNGVGKKMRLGYLNGQVSESAVMAMYRKNKKEADSFSLFGYRANEIRSMMLETHNPLLKRKLQECIESKREISKKSDDQNKINLEKLELNINKKKRVARGSVDFVDTAGARQSSS